MPVFLSVLSSVLKVYKLYLLYLRDLTLSIQLDILYSTDLYFNTKLHVKMKLTDRPVQRLANIVIYTRHVN